MPRINPYNIHVPNLTTWTKFDKIPTDTWDKSNPADYVMVDVGLNNGRGISGFINKHLKAVLENGFAKKLGAVTKLIGGFLPFPVSTFGDLFGKAFSLETSLNGIDFVKNVKTPFYTEPAGIEEIKNALNKHILPTYNSAIAYHLGMLIKRLCGSILDRFAVLRSGNFESNDGKTILLSAFVLQVIVKENIFPNWYFNNPEKTSNIFADENFKKFIYGLVAPKYKIDDIKELCNFLSVFEYSTDKKFVDNFNASLTNQQNNTAAGNENLKLIIPAIGLGIGLFAMTKK